MATVQYDPHTLNKLQGKFFDRNLTPTTECPVQPQHEEQETMTDRFNSRKGKPRGLPQYETKEGLIQKISDLQLQQGSRVSRCELTIFDNGGYTELIRAGGVIEEDIPLYKRVKCTYIDHADGGISIAFGSAPPKTLPWNSSTSKILDIRKI